MTIKNTLFGIAVVIVSIIFATYISLQILATQKASASPAGLRYKQLSGTVLATATTSLTYMAPSGGAQGVATSSMTIVASDLHGASLSIWASPSTTPATVNAFIHGSFNGIDWFSYREASTTYDKNDGYARTFYPASTTPLSFRLPGGSMSTSTHVVPIPYFPANYLKVEFNVENSNVALQAIIQGKQEF